MNIEQDNSFDTVASMDSRGFYLKNLQRFHNEPTGDERREKCTTLLESILRLGFRTDNTIAKRKRTNNDLQDIHIKLKTE
jgi:hypothetical protein